MFFRRNLKRSSLLVAAIVFVSLLIVTVVIWGAAAKPADTAPRNTEAVGNSGGQRGKKILDTDQEILIETIEEGVQNLGVLVTQEYNFTDTVTQSKVKTLFNIPLGFTETSYVATYDGVVTAGIDFTRIRIGLSILEKKVTIQMPGAEIQNVDVDPGSFVLYSEKSGLGNPLSVSDFNGSIIELENKARDRAVERGLLTKADENARQIVSNFVGGFLDLTKYDIIWESE